jgi:hypothetical protein
MRSQINGYVIGPADPNSALAQAETWTPKRLSPLAWWRADVVDLVGSKVAAMPDQSGNGAHLLQTTDSLRPTYVSSVAGRKGQPCIETTSAGQLLTAAGVTLPREVALWVVTGTIATQGFVLTHLVGANRSHYLYLPGVAAMNVTNAAGSLFFARFSSWATGKIVNRSLLGLYDGTNIDVFSNNINENGTTSGAAVPASSQTGTVGLMCSPDGVNPSVMQVFEAAIFPAEQLVSVSARAALQAYQAARYVP